MRWLFSQQLRPFVTLAAGASLLLNLALLAPALYMLQVFDRVFASGSIETLVMLSIPVLIMLAFGYFMDAARARALAAAGRRVESSLAPAALGNQLRQAATVGAGRTDDALRDVAQLRTLLASTGVVALFDAPWVPLYLLLIALHASAARRRRDARRDAAGGPEPAHGVRHAPAHRTGVAGRARHAPACRLAGAQCRSHRRHGNDRAGDRRVAGTMRQATCGAGKTQRGQHALRCAGAHGAAVPPGGSARPRRMARDRPRSIAGHHDRSHHPVRPRASTRGVPDRRLEGAQRSARRLESPVRTRRRRGRQAHGWCCPRRKAVSTWNGSCSAPCQTGRP